tara:strand:- start:1230 stop:1739 length:510 start_codon:yes stop_codon:yes gene_type:complete
MIPHQFNLAFNMNDENGKYKFRMPVAPAYLQKHYQQKCLWDCTRITLDKDSTLADNQLILIRLNVPSSQTFICGSAGSYANFQSESQCQVQFFTNPEDSNRVDWTNYEDTILTTQIGASAWGNDLEVSVYVVDKDGVFTLCDTNNEVIQLQLQCVAYDDQYDYERFKDK